MNLSFSKLRLDSQEQSLRHVWSIQVVFLHKPSKILIASDLVWNYPSEVPLGTRIWKFGMDQVYLPFYRAFMIKDPGTPLFVCVEGRRASLKEQSLSGH